MNTFFLLGFIMFIFHPLAGMKQNDNTPLFTMGKIVKSEKKQKSRKKSKKTLKEKNSHLDRTLDKIHTKKVKILFKDQNEREEDLLIDLFSEKIQCSESEESVIINLFQKFYSEDFYIVCKEMFKYTDEKTYDADQKLQFFKKALSKFRENSQFSCKEHIKNFLMYCIQHNIAEMIEPCLQVETFEKDTDHSDFLNAACQHNSPEVLQIFINHGMNVNIMCDELYGSTPLHHAVMAESVSCVKILLHDKHINVDIKDFEGFTAKDYIKNNNYVLQGLFEKFLKKSEMDESPY